MTDEQQPNEPAVREMLRVRQIRQYRPDPVPEPLQRQLTEIARWTGSSRNTQPWHFVVITDPDQLRRLSEIRTAITWVAAAPLAIAIVLNGDSQVSEAYDEGRVTERLLVAAHLLGLGGGTAWYGDDDQQAAARAILGVPEGRTARSLVTLGYPMTAKDPRPNAARGGRRPVEEVVSRETFGTR